MTGEPYGCVRWVTLDKFGQDSMRACGSSGSSGKVG
jgi:hypothetical protein